ncbi:hypothetical protein [Desulfovibrio sp. UCD-KL4C]|uniref:hypothetical protein n=1 Tax=Desulfovibrio sp. UCD-KL4C TaxID=2578120 RepID=UPI0025BB32E1|nr:hypothetical protein [Desulfovibrio sp. UCD-KL4C]
MKKVFILLLLTLFAAMPEIVMASSYDLTLTGTVTGGTIGTLAQAANVNIGSTVSYTLRINTDELGYTLNQNGEKSYKNNTYYMTTSGLLNGKSKKITNLSNYILDQKNSDPRYSRIGGLFNDGKSVIKLNLSNNDLTSILEGTLTNLKTGEIYEESLDPNSNENRYSQLVVKNLTVKASPTPIPGTILIMLSGLGIIVLLKRKFAPALAA